MIIAIDGPAASGKSTTARLIAERLNFTHIDTGAMYRAVTFYLLENQIPLNNFTRINNSLTNIHLEFSKEGNITLNGRDISVEIRENDVNNNVSEVSAILEVREKLVEMQRQMAMAKDIVMEGRDIGTRVFPNADYKFFIVADVLERSRRRCDEMKEKGLEIVFDQVVLELKRRDQIDSNRKYSPLKKADDAIVIDTTAMTIPEQVDFLINIINS